jgi:hypothetical protein
LLNTSLQKEALLASAILMENMEKGIRKEGNCGRKRKKEESKGKPKWVKYSRKRQN